MAPTPKAKVVKTKVAKAKVAKRAPRAQASGAGTPLSNDDLITVAVAIRNGDLKVDTTKASQELGITKKAWSARWIRAKTRLAQVEADATTASTSKAAEDDHEDDDTDDNTSI